MFVEAIYILHSYKVSQTLLQLALGEDSSPSISVGMMWSFYMVMILAVLVLLPAGESF